MDLLEILLIIGIITVCMFTLVDRVCKCCERVASTKAMSVSYVAQCENGIVEKKEKED